MTKRSAPAPEQPEPRREARRAVDLAGFALLDDNSTFELILTDLTYDGCQVKTDKVLEPGAKLKLSVVRLGTSWSVDPPLPEKAAAASIVPYQCQKRGRARTQERRKD